MSRKNRERRRLRQEQKRYPAPPGDGGEHAEFLSNFEQLRIPEPISYPGGCHASLARPDLVKLELAEFAVNRPPGRQKFRQLERRLADGLLGMVPNIDHWAVEEFLWHGLPGDPWQPVEVFIEHQRERFSPEAALQLRRWQDARIGFFEVGIVADDCVTLREFDPRTQVIGSDFRAISLGLGGVNYYREHMDAINLTYVAPWAPEQSIYCAMGYGLVMSPARAPLYTPLLGLRQPELMARPFPWKAGPDEARRHAHEWRQRSWPDWLGARLTFPFLALVPGETGAPELIEITALLPSTPEEFELVGLYLASGAEGEGDAFGATAVLPIDPTAANAMVLAEYRAYRERVGPPRIVQDAEDRF